MGEKMNSSIIKVVNDCQNWNLPTKLENLDKCKCTLKTGQKVGIIYKEDLEYAKEWMDNLGDIHNRPFFSGYIVALPDKDTGRFLDVEDVMVVITDYPTEKCFPLTDWIALNRLLDNDDLVEIYNYKDQLRPEKHSGNTTSQNVKKAQNAIEKLKIKFNQVIDSRDH